MNVLFIAPFDLRIHNGTSIRVYNLARAASKICRKVFLLAPYINDDFKTINNIIWIKMRSLEVKHQYLLTYMDLTMPWLSKRVVRSLLGLHEENTKDLEEEVDVVHVHWLLNLPITRVLSKTYKHQSVLVDVHGSFLLQEPIPANIRDCIAVCLGRLHERAKIRDPTINGFTVPSDAFGIFLALSYGISFERIHTVPDAVDIDALVTSSCDDMGYVEELQRISEKYKVIAYVGSISKYHGFYDLLMAFHIIKRKVSNLKLLLIVPRTSFLKAVLRGLDNDCIVLENVPRKILPCILRYADTLVLPHRAGTQFDYIPSNKIYDYVLAGKPIVAYRTPIIRLVLRNYKMSFLVRPNDPIELAKGIIKALKVSEKSESSSSIVKVPTVDDVVNALKRVYRIVLKEV